MAKLTITLGPPVSRALRLSGADLQGTDPQGQWWIKRVVLTPPVGFNHEECDECNQEITRRMWVCETGRVLGECCVTTARKPSPSDRRWTPVGVSNVRGKRGAS